MPPVNISVSIDDILETALHQNFVPVVDDRSIFIGIITRQTLLRALGSSSLQPSLAAMPNSENASTRI
ncbi:CBS domain-containing protein [Allobaculum sp. Allo2]